MAEPVQLSDGVVLLRPYRLDDVPRLVAAVRESIPELKPWMSWCYDGFGEHDAQKWIESLPAGWEAGTNYQFAITAASDGEFLGGCSLSHVSSTYRMANLGYWVHTGRTRRGIASRAVRLMARFAFERVELVRVEIVVAVDNRASLRVAEKVGATREGVLRNRMPVRDRIHDAVMHSLIPQDLKDG